MIFALKIIGIVVLIIIAAAALILIYTKYKFNNIKDKKDLQGLIDKKALSFLNSGKTYGIVIGVYKNGKSYIQGYGTIKRGTSIKPGSSTLFELASTSKLFTTSVLQILSDKGILSLDDKISDILQRKLKLPETAKNTTLRHLATHCSGFPSLPQSFINKMTDENNPYKDLTIEDLYDYLKTCEGKKPEGEFEYSNFGMGLLGHLLELKTNTKYEELIKNELLIPLGMQQTSITLNDTLQKLLAQGYNEKGNPNPVWVDNVLTGAGSFLSTRTDMIEFIKANLTAPVHRFQIHLLKLTRNNPILK